MVCCQTLQILLAAILIAFLLCGRLWRVLHLWVSERLENRKCCSPVDIYCPKLDSFWNANFSRSNILNLMGIVSNVKTAFFLGGGIFGGSKFTLEKRWHCTLWVSNSHQGRTKEEITLLYINNTVCALKEKYEKFCSCRSTDNIVSMDVMSWQRKI